MGTSYLYGEPAQGSLVRLKGYFLCFPQRTVISGMASATIRPGDFCKLWLAGGGGKEELKMKALQNVTDTGCETFPRTRRWREMEFDLWTKKRPQGFGAVLFKGNSNCWLPQKGRPQWKESDLIRALQMRTTVLPTLVPLQGWISWWGTPLTAVWEATRAGITHSWRLRGNKAE